MNKFNSLKEELKKILLKSPLKFDSVHSKLTLKWLLKLKPNADEYLQIAAIAHDIERAVTGITEKDLKDYSKIAEFKQQHAIRSANITADLLKKYGYEARRTVLLILIIIYFFILKGMARNGLRAKLNLCIKDFQRMLKF